MLKTLKRYFDEHLSNEQDEPSEHAQQLAAAALLFEVSRSDYEIDVAERERIRELVTKEFKLDGEQARELMSLAEEQAAESTSLHGFTSLINSHWTMDQRIQLVEYLWRVAFADEKLSEHELHVIRKVGRLLYVPHKQFIAAKIRARESARSPGG